MSIETGTQLGPYEVLAPLGAGGMGEVYRARDTRLGREVAIKVLPTAFSNDPDRLCRFEQEARAAGMLNHPNILTVYDFGTHDGAPYIVSELLEGETLRDRIGAGALPLRKAIDYALQTARGLSAAHEKDIVHRDLKPENLFITRDGRVKILDFGLAKLVQPKPDEGTATNAPTQAAHTMPGAIMGTVGYMAPEQVRGQEVDHRADIFAFGVILYEMLGGRRAFQGQSAIDVMGAILNADPPNLVPANPNVPPALERVVRHCMEKIPEDRFQSTRDLAFNLEALSTPFDSEVSSVTPISTPAARRTLFSWPILAAAILIVAATSIIAFWSGKNAVEHPAPSFHRLTYRRGAIQSARFAPDGKTIVYAAAWDGGPLQLFLGRIESPEARPLGLPDGDLLGISSAGEIAMLLGRRSFDLDMTVSSTLARVPLVGGTPREILEGVKLADWAPDGNSLAVWRQVGDRNRLEFPIGTVLYETNGNAQSLRVSPKGDLIALMLYEGNVSGIVVVDRTGKKKSLTEGWGAPGLAWSPEGDEVWFTGTQFVDPPFLSAVKLSGRVRLIERVVGWLWIQDRSRDGRVLMTHNTSQGGIAYFPEGEAKVRDLSWLDWSMLADFSSDGKTILFSEGREGAGGTTAKAPGVVCLRRTDGSPAVQLGNGIALGLSPDGKSALVIRFNSSPPQLVVLPTGAGEARPLKTEGIICQWAGWFPDGKRILLAGNTPQHRGRLYVLNLDGGKPTEISPEGVFLGEVLTEGDGGGFKPISPDGKLVAAVGPERRIRLYPVEGGEPREVPALAPGELPICWSEDGHVLFVSRRGELPARIYRVDLNSGRKDLWKEITLPDPAGIYGVDPILLTPDGKSYVYSYRRALSNLYLVEGLK